MKKLITLLILFFGFSTMSFAYVYNPNNGHFYERYDDSVTWVQAKALAENLSYMGVQGHLATITSDEENWWIVNNLGGAATLDHWLGGYKQDDNWHWITEEIWDYTNWWNGYGWIEPSGDGDALQFDDAYVEGVSPIPGYWNDLDKYVSEPGYIVEFDTAAVPIPSTFLLLATSLTALIGLTIRQYIRNKTTL